MPHLWMETNLFLKYIGNLTDIDDNGFFDIIAHGNPKGIQVTQWPLLCYWHDENQVAGHG